MTTGTLAATADAAVRETLDAWAEAARARDLPAILAHYAEDVVAFDAVDALRFVGKAAYAGHWERCLRECPGQTIFELHDLHVRAVGELALCAYLCRCGYTDGTREQSGWMRGTVALQRSGGRWRIFHEHHSAPFDLGSGKALCDLAP